MKQYIAQVYILLGSGDEISFMCTPGTHHEKIRRIKQGRTVLEERVRFIEKKPQNVMSYSDIPRLESKIKEDQAIKEQVYNTWRHS